MPLAPLTFFDTYSRTESGTWGTADSGNAWLSSGTIALDVNGGSGKITSPANSGRGHVSFDLGDIPRQGTNEILSLLSWTGSASWPLTDFGPVLNNTQNKHLYGMTLQGNYAEIALIVYSNGYRYELARVSYPLEKNAKYWVRFRVTDKVYGKIWREGTHEPTSWTISNILWDGSTRIGAGGPGFFKVGTRDTYTASIHHVAYYSLEDTHPSVYPQDTFEVRPVSNGWGISSSKHVWEGVVQSDPAYFGLHSQGSVSSGIGFLTPTTTAEHAASIGPPQSGDIESAIRIRMSGTGSGQARIGIRGTTGTTSNRMGVYGYSLLVDSASNTIYIQKRTSITGTWATLATSPAQTFDLFSTTSWTWVKFKIVGSTLSAKIWQDGVTNTVEPAEWHVTATDNTYTSGKCFLTFVSAAPGDRTFQVGTLSYQPPTPEVGETQNYSVTGALTQSGSTDTSISCQYTYTGDVNNNSTVRLSYKPITSSVWVFYTTSGVPTYANKNYTATISGLEAASDYHLRLEHVDPDSVQGPNPITITASTLDRGIKPSEIYVSDVSASSATIKASYLRDTDNDSTAELSYRVSSAATYVIEDEFVDENDGTLLQNVNSIHGGSWEKHVPVSGANQGVIEFGRAFAQTKELDSDRILYTHTNEPDSSEYDITFSIFTAQMAGILGVTSHTSTTAETYYGAGINFDDNQWEIFKMVNGTKTVLVSKSFEDIEGLRIYNLQYVVRNAYKALILNNTEILRTTDTSVSGGTRPGFYSGGVPRGTVQNQVVLDSFHVSYRSLPGSWQNAGPMSVNRTAKEFTRNLTGLAGDTVYEFLVTFSDLDGVFGGTLSISAMTLGRAAALNSVGVTPNQTTATIDAFYSYDDNDNSYLQVQYRSTMETIWTVVPYSRIDADRVIKKFSITLDALKPRTTYEIKVDIIDPDGLVVGTPSQLSGLFTTTGFAVEATTRNKHYIWKFYDDNDKYMGTLPISPEPIFSIQENGGVTDLSFELPTKASETGPYTMINFQNRIDVWAIDPSSSGMGPNLIQDPECDPDVGGWVTADNALYHPTQGPDGSSCLRILSSSGIGKETISNPLQHNLLPVSTESPMVIECVARAKGSSMQMYVRAYDQNDIPIEISDEIGETVGDRWQKLRISYQAPPGTAYIRVVIRNTNRGTMWADKFSVKAKEIMVYRGRIEAYSPKIDQNGERVAIEALGLSSLLSDDYIQFLQFVEVQPVNDQSVGRPNNGAADPADMMKRVIDEARNSNPTFALYYTTDSIRYTGQLAQYTFRDQQVRSCMDKIRSLCPSGWHYFIGTDGLVTLRGPEHAQTHYLRLGVEVMNFEVDRSIRNLKNYVRVKGRQDEDMTETDGHGSINYITFNQESIDKYGKRVLFLRDAQITDPETAKMVGDGRLDENNREEQRVSCEVPDEKTFKSETGSLIGYNIESFLPGDNVKILDPIGGLRASYWDRMIWDKDQWDYSNEFRPLPESVPIKSVEYRGDHVKLSLSERPPSQVGDYSRLARWVADRDRD